MTNNRYLVWLEWPEACFRAQPEDIRYLKALVPRGSSVSCVHSEAAFLRALPRATHAIVWSFRHEWFAKAKNLKVLATPGAGRELVAHTEVPAGVTVHFVDAGTDSGPIIVQKCVPVQEDDTPETLHARIQVQEHLAFPEARRLLAAGRLSVEGRRVRIAK